MTPSELTQAQQLKLYAMKEFTYMTIFVLSLLLVLQGVDKLNFTFWVGLGIFVLDCLLMKDNNDNGKNDGKANAA